MNSPMQPRALGRYLLYAPIASGGMATVFLARMAGPKGFSRIVAIKQLHAQLVHDADFVAMFVDEAHLIGRIHHSNVVAPIDVIEADGDLCIVMEYVHGEALGRLMRLARRDRIPLRIASAILVQTLLGLHAAHELTDGDGQPLSVVHLDVSPQNILIGEDGITRVVDFGIAQAAHRARPADTSKLKGKLGYMAPEQLMLGELDRRSDLFAAGIILWEMLTGKKLFSSSTPSEATERMSAFQATPPSSIVTTLSPELDAIAVKALCVDPNGRFDTALDMAKALESACPPAGAIEVAEWVTQLVSDTLSMRAQWISELVNMDLSEWTQTYVMSSSVPTDAGAGPNGSAGSNRPPAGDGRAQPALVALEPPPTANSQPGGVSSSAPPGLTFLGPKLPLLRLGAAAFVVAVVAIAMVGATRRARTVAQSPRLEVSVLAASPQNPASAGPLDSAPTTLASAPLEKSAAVTAGAAGALPHHSDAPAASPHPPAARATENGAQPDCRVPYVVDAKKIKRFRPECFGKH